MDAGLTFNTSENSSVVGNESLDHLNARYAEALFPLTITFGIFTALGFLGNGIILIVFSISREYKRNNFKVFVLTLAVIDLVTCMTLIPAEMVKQRHYFDFGDVVPCKVKCFFNVFGASSSCSALLVISIDRFRKVVQPFRNQMSPKLAVQILFVLAFVFPVLLAIPGTVMCGIKRVKMTNIYGGKTEIHFCETEDIYQDSVWRLVYKCVLISLLVVMSLTYIVLYTFVMRAAMKQIRAMATQRGFSNYETTFSSGIYDPNTICREPSDVNLSPAKKMTLPSAKSQTECLINGTLTCSNSSVVVNSPSENKLKTSPKQTSVRKPRGQGSMLQRRGFPTKTLIWFILTIVFIITYMIHNMLNLKRSDVVNMTAREFATYSFFYRIYFFNHVINPVVYAIFVKRFRQSCRSLIPTIKKKLAQCGS